MSTLLLHYVESRSSATDRRRSRRFEVCTQERIDRHCRGDESLFLFCPLNPPKPPPLCFGDAREGTVGDLSSRARRGTTPLAKHSWLLRSAARSATWSTPPGSNIKLSSQTNNANPKMWKYRYLGVCFLLKRNPERIGQSPVLELGRQWSPISLDFNFKV